MKKAFKQIYAFFLAVMLVLPYAKESISIGNELFSVSVSIALQNSKPGNPPPPPLPDPIPIENS